MLVNNAAANFPVPAEDMSPNAWRTVVDITLNGTFFCCREFGRRHLAAGTPGSIVNIGASYAWTGGPGFAHSAAAKAGVKNMTETLAVEWGPYGIQVNGLVPGLFPHEDMTADIQGNLAAHDDKDDCQPALRVGQPQELGWAATFLASPYARVHLRPHARGRRRQLAAPHAHQPAGRDRPRPDGPRPLRAHLTRRRSNLVTIEVRAPAVTGCRVDGAEGWIRWRRGGRGRSRRRAPRPAPGRAGRSFVEHAADVGLHRGLGDVQLARRSRRSTGPRAMARSTSSSRSVSAVERRAAPRRRGVAGARANSSISRRVTAGREQRVAAGDDPDGAR